MPTLARTARRIRNHRRRIEADGELRRLVAELLIQRWSPQLISRHLRLRFPEQSGMWLCHESIYQAVYQPGSGLLRPSRLASHRRSPLRTGRDHRRAHQRTERRRARFEHPILTIHQRPFPPEDRSLPVNDGDTVAKFAWVFVGGKFHGQEVLPTLRDYLDHTEQLIDEAERLMDPQVTS
jgi:IS30 family transposase